MRGNGGGGTRGEEAQEDAKMTVENEYYHCEICGIVVRVVAGGGGTLVCCGQDMVKISEDEAKAAASGS